MIENNFYNKISNLTANDNKFILCVFPTYTTLKVCLKFFSDVIEKNYSTSLNVKVSFANNTCYINSSCIKFVVVSNEDDAYINLAGLRPTDIFINENVKPEYINLIKSRAIQVNTLTLFQI